MKTQKETQLNRMLDAYDNAQEALRLAQAEAYDRKLHLACYALDNNLIDCLTVNIPKLRKYGYDHNYSEKPVI